MDENNKEVYLIEEERHIKEGEELVLTDKKLFIGKTIKCEGALIIENCDIVYASGLAYNSAIIAKTGAIVNIKKCNITEKGPHKCKFIKVGFSNILETKIFSKMPIMLEKLSKDSMEYYHKESKLIKNAYGKLENQDENSDIKNMDSIVIENCTFTNKRGIFSKLFEKANKKEEYILLDCGGIVKDCTFNIDTKCKYGIIRGAHNPRVYLHRIKNQPFRYPAIDSSKGQDYDYYNFNYVGKEVAVNILRTKNYRQTKVINCEFNKSNFGILGNCIVKDSKFNNCDKAIQDVYDIKDCTFDNCNDAVVRNTDINIDDAANNNTFSNNKYNIKKRMDKRTAEKSLFLFIGMLAWFIILFYFLIVDLSLIGIEAKDLPDSHLKRDLIAKIVSPTFGCIYISKELIKKSINYIRTGRSVKRSILLIMCAIIYILLYLLDVCPYVHLLYSVLK